MHELREPTGHSDGTPAALHRDMATRTNRPSEAWTISLHVVMWATMTVAVIMVFVVVMLH